MDASHGALWAEISAHRGRLMRLAQSRGLSADDAEDCVSEAMLRCVEFERLDQERLGAFLTTVTIRLCADGHRARKYRDRLTHRLSAEPTIHPAADDAVCDQAEATWLAAQIDGLPARQQAVVYARAEGLSAAEIAERLRMSRTAVESQIARARAALRSVRVASWGVLLPRWRAVVAGGASLSAALLLSVPALDPPEHVRRPPAGPAVAAPEAPHAIATAVGTRVARPVRRGVAKVRPVVRRLPSGAPVTIPADPAPWIRVGDATVGPDRGYDEDSEVERVEQCVTYGIEIDSERIGCRTPPPR